MGCMPCNGGDSQWVRVPPGNVAPDGSSRSTHVCPSRRFIGGGTQPSHLTSDVRQGGSIGALRRPDPMWKVLRIRRPRACGWRITIYDGKCGPEAPT